MFLLFSSQAAADLSFVSLRKKKKETQLFLWCKYFGTDKLSRVKEGSLMLGGDPGVATTRRLVIFQPVDFFEETNIIR